jgi:protein-tyrosine phosphatase
MKPDLYRIPGPWRGYLAIVARPRGGDWLNDEASGWRESGIDTIVSLLEEEESAQLDLTTERQAAEGRGITFVSFPIPDRGVPASVDSALSTIRALAGQLERGKNVAVHCRQGIGRSGLIAVGVLLTAGTPLEEAIRIVSSARGLPIPETLDQRRWIDQIAPRLLATNTSGFESVA